MDDGGGLENRYAGDCIMGSNPIPSATDNLECYKEGEFPARKLPPLCICIGLQSDPTQSREGLA